MQCKKTTIANTHTVAEGGVKVEVNVIIKRVLVLFLLCLKLFAREAIEEKMRKISVRGFKRS